MSALAPASRSADLPGRALALLSVVAVALGAAFVAVPRLVAGRPGDSFADQPAIIGALRPAFVEFWQSGDRELPAHLQGLVDYWFRYHVAKTVTATLLLIVLVALGMVLWKAFLRAGAPGTRIALASGGVLVTVLAVFAVVLIMANVQGAMAPLSSVLTLLEVGAPHGELATTIDQVRQQLADYPTVGQPVTPALTVLVSDFGWYHSVMVVIASSLAVGFLGVSAMFWMKRAGTASTGRRARRVLAAFGVFSTVLSLGLIVLAVGNTTVAANPAPALLAFYQGGW